MRLCNNLNASAMLSVASGTNQEGKFVWKCELLLFILKHTAVVLF